ncbi:MAG: dihydropteroate synthase [Armatimonadota bacterium]|nr:dihydropteroate synthase [Armatimonadota bacterium]
MAGLSARVLVLDHPRDRRQVFREMGLPPSALEKAEGRGVTVWTKLIGVPRSQAEAIQSVLESRGILVFAREGEESVDILGGGSREEFSSLEGALEGADGARALHRALEGYFNPPSPLEVGEFRLDFSRRVYIVGILNVTPNSFYDQGKYFSQDRALARAEEMVKEGADIVEVGGETLRPAEPPISVEEEIRRVVPVIEVLSARLPVPIAVDTFKPEVARRAVEAGAVIINDPSGLADPRMAEVARDSGSGLVVTHIQGRIKVDNPNPRYHCLMDEVYRFLWERTEMAARMGVKRTRLIVDPGFSLGKQVHHDLEILRRLGEFRSLGYPIYLATSRKTYIREVLGLPDGELLEGTAAAVAYGVSQGANLVRTHDVQFMARLVRMMEAILGFPRQRQGGISEQRSSWVQHPP